MSEVANQVAEWLHNFGYRAEPVSLQIGKKQWEGARYFRCDSDCAKENERIYLVGEMPPQINTTTFLFEGSEWYVSSHFQKDEVPAKIANYHPFGKSWQLKRHLDSWPFNDGRPYRKMTATILQTQEA